jgi:SAM-dependent methyltransferase
MTDNRLRGSFNAWILDAFDGYMHRKYGHLKIALFGELPPVVVEIGPGTGGNFRYYPPGTRLIAVEPNQRMHQRLRLRGARFGLQVELHSTGAEDLDIETDSVDFVCSTLVLCSVADPVAVVAEVLRVLKPGGRFVCIEHVAASPGSGLEMLQRTLARPWHWLFEGCDLCRDTESVLRAGGFTQVEVRQFQLDTAFIPVRDQIAATCTA